jgi:hypothetical protein
MLLVTALFTKSDGDPATGLTLTDIDLYLYSRQKSDGTTATVWNGENPSEEIGGGVYSKSYSSEDLDTYTYHAYAQYTGATSLDSNYSLQSSSSDAVELSDDSVSDVNAQVLDVLNTDTFSELTSVPGATATITAMIRWIYALARNEIQQTSTTQTLRNDADTGNIATATVSYDSATFTREEWS